MMHLVHRRPSASMVVAVTALVVAASGTAVAATNLTNGDSLIAKHTLSGNRLRNNTVTGQQIKVSSLGTVPSATHASTADTATNATNATNATYHRWWANEHRPIPLCSCHGRLPDRVSDIGVLTVISPV